MRRYGLYLNDEATEAELLVRVSWSPAITSDRHPDTWLAPKHNDSRLVHYLSEDTMKDSPMGDTFQGLAGAVLLAEDWLVRNVGYASYRGHLAWGIDADPKAVRRLRQTMSRPRSA